MSDEKQNELPGIPPGQPSDPGTVFGNDSLAKAPLFDGGTGTGAKVQAVRAGQKADAKGSGKRSKNPTLATPPTSDQQPLPKAPRAPRKRSKKAVVALQQGQQAVHPAPAANQVIPRLTDEAATFLGRPDATPADLLKLGPDSIAFVRHHYNFMEEVEASSRLNNAYLIANTRPVSAAFQKFADALVKQARIKPPVGQELPVAKVAEPKKQGSPNTLRASYGQKVSTVPVYTPVAIQFGKLELAIENTKRRQQNLKTLAEDATRMHRVIGTAQTMMSMQVDDLTPKAAAEMVTADLLDLHAIKDDQARRLALKAMAESSQAQPKYRTEFERQAPEAARQLEQADEHIENSIEPSPGRLISNERQVPIKSVAPSPQVAAAAVKRVGVGERLLTSVGGAAQKAGFWLSDRGKASERPTTKVSSSETKRGTSATPAVPVAAGHDKSTFVPEAVARRFLKVEQDYFFHDRTPAFVDRGNKLATRGANPEVVRSLVEIARARGWDSITVKGTDEFRRSAWMEAAQNGLKVAGYKPTPLDLAELSSRPARNILEKGTEKEKGSSSREQAAAEDAAAGPTQTTAAAFTEKGGTTEVQNLKPDRELAEKAKAFQENKPAFVVKKYPDLVGAYGIVEAAKAFAVEKLPEAARDEFVGMARRHVMQKIITGDTVKGPKIYMTAAKAREAGDSAITSVTGAPDLGKSPRTKEVARER